MGSFFDNVFDIFKKGDVGRKEKRNNTASNNNLTSMKDIHVSMGEDPGTLEDLEDGEL